MKKRGRNIKSISSFLCYHSQLCEPSARIRFKVTFMRNKGFEPLLPKSYPAVLQIKLIALCVLTGGIISASPPILTGTKFICSFYHNFITLRTNLISRINDCQFINYQHVSFSFFTQPKPSEDSFACPPRIFCFRSMRFCPRHLKKEGSF